MDRIRSATTPNVVLYEIRTFWLQVTETQNISKMKEMFSSWLEGKLHSGSKGEGQGKDFTFVLHSKERRAV